MRFHRFLPFIIYELPNVPWKYIRVVSRYLFPRIEFIISLLLDWMALKCREPSLSCHLTHSWRKKRRIHAFPKSSMAKVSTTDETGVWTRLTDSTFRHILPKIPCLFRVQAIMTLYTLLFLLSVDRHTFVGNIPEWFPVAFSVFILLDWSSLHC